MTTWIRKLSIEHWVNGWVFIFSLTVLSTPGHGGEAILTLTLTALFLLFFKKETVYPLKLDNSEKIFISLVLLFWIIQVTGAIYQPSGYEYETI